MKLHFCLSLSVNPESTQASPYNSRPYINSFDENHRENPFKSPITNLPCNSPSPSTFEKNSPSSHPSRPDNLPISVFLDPGSYKVLRLIQIPHCTSTLEQFSSLTSALSQLQAMSAANPLLPTFDSSTYHPSGFPLQIRPISSKIPTLTRLILRQPLSSSASISHWSSGNRTLHFTSFLWTTHLTRRSSHE